MKIKDNRGKPFKKVVPGECFEHRGTFYLKTASVGVDLESGMNYGFHPDVIVKPLDATVTFK